MNKNSKAACILLLGITSLFAGPVTTVPWNGYTGAVSFTYDDARDGQLPNLLPQLDSLHIKATFEIAAASVGTFTSHLSQWIQVSKNGHELANHTYYHQNMPTSDPAATDTIKHMATYLRGLDSSIQSVTFAYPNCSIGGENGVSTENFIGRGCANGIYYSWTKQPTDWMNIQGLIVTSATSGGTDNVSTAISQLGTAKTNNTWTITIIHDVVNPPPDQYSQTPAKNLSVLAAGVSNNLWMDTYSRIGSYYRAHFTMDTVNVLVVPSGGWSMNWVSPHPKMPKSVPLRVNLATATFGTSFTVQQNGVTIPKESDGTYIIDFMKLSMQVLQGTSGIKSRVILPSKLDARMGANGIRFEGVYGEVEATVVDVHGKKVFHGRVSNRLIPLRNDQMQGILFLTLSDRASRSSLHAMVTTVR